MLTQRYIDKAKETISAFDPEGANRYFIFGSAARNERFGDVDIGVIGNKTSRKNLANLRETFEGSTFPYFVDIVDIDEASDSFTSYVQEHEKAVWLR